MTYLPNKERPFYTYAHYKADTGEIFYVGKGVDDKNNRAYSKNSRNEHWHNVVNKHGFIVRIIADFELEIDVFRTEVHLIAMIGRKDKGLGPLVNWTDGGEGESGRICKPETREKIRKNKKSTLGPYFGKNLPAPTCQKMKENHADFTGEKHPNYGSHWYTNGIEDFMLLETDEKIKELKLERGMSREFSVEERAGKSKRFKGEKNPMYGTTWSDNTREKMKNRIPWNKGLTKKDPRVAKNVKNSSVTRNRNLKQKP